MIQYEELRKKIRENDQAAVHPVIEEIRKELGELRAELEADYDENSDEGSLQIFDKLLSIVGQGNAHTSAQARELTWADWDSPPQQTRPVAVTAAPAQVRLDVPKIVQQLAIAHPDHFADVRAGKYSQAQVVGYIMSIGYKQQDAEAIYDEVMKHGSQAS